MQIVCLHKLNLTNQLRPQTGMTYDFSFFELLPQTVCLLPRGRAWWEAPGKHLPGGVAAIVKFATGYGIEGVFFLLS